MGPDHDIDELGYTTTKALVSQLRVDSAMGDHENEHAQITKGNTDHLPIPLPSSAHMHPSGAIPVDDTLANEEDDDDDYFDSDDDDHHCSICTEQYTDCHPAFRLTVCGHTFGKDCISTWVNSTARNANLCPQCRATLCK